MVHNDRPAVFWNESSVAVDHNLFEILSDHSFQLWAYLISTPAIIVRELFGRSNLGEGALKTEGIDISRFVVIRPNLLLCADPNSLKGAIKQMSHRPAHPVESEIHQPDRRALDDVIFDVLGLTRGERDAVYEAVVNLVQARLKKAESV